MKELILKRETWDLYRKPLITILWCSLLCLFLISCEEETKPLPTTGRAIKSFKIENGQIGAEMVDVENFTVHVTIDSSVDLTAVVPEITASEGASISPASGVAIDISKNLEYRYVVTAASGQSREWIIYFEIVDNNINTMEYGTFIIAGVSGNKVPGVEGNLLYNDKYWDRAVINLQNNEGRKWQKWHFIFEKEENGKRYFTLRNLFSGLYLTLHEGNETNGTLFQDQAYSEGRDKQLWTIQTTETGKYKIVNKQ
ncbi:MAG TPA: hypothetical protein DCS09_06835, partial [Porphyromonadaceae bacterium]|nr:hypothetical protein [Porphyromonadaceae bacterium]